MPAAESCPAPVRTSRCVSGAIRSRPKVRRGEVRGGEAGDVGVAHELQLRCQNRSYRTAHPLVRLQKDDRLLLRHPERTSAGTAPLGRRGRSESAVGTPSGASVRRVCWYGRIGRRGTQPPSPARELPALVVSPASTMARAHSDAILASAHSGIQLNPALASRLSGGVAGGAGMKAGGVVPQFALGVGGDAGDAVGERHIGQEERERLAGPASSEYQSMLRRVRARQGQQSPLSPPQEDRAARQGVRGIEGEGLPFRARCEGRASLGGMGLFRPIR